MLTDAKIKAAKPKEKDYKLGDSGRLYLLVTKTGSKLWRLNYTFGLNAKGKPAEKTVAIGSYPQITLVEARRERDRLKDLIREGRDPSVEKKAGVTANRVAERPNTFERIALNWFELRSGWSVSKFRAWCDRHNGKWDRRDGANWMTRTEGVWSVVHSGDVLNSLGRDVFPVIGAMPIGDIESPTILDMLNRIVDRGAIETAHRTCQRIYAVYVYAIAAGVAMRNPAASVSKALPKIPRSKRQPSVVDRVRGHEGQVLAMRKMLGDCDAVRCRALTKLAQRLCALTAVRSNEIRFAVWDEFEDMDGLEPLWRIPAARMKGNEDRKNEDDGDHLVPLSQQAVEVLRVVWRLTGNYQLLFPNETKAHQVMSENTLRDHLVRAGYYKWHVPHGHRSAFSTIMNQWPDRNPDDRAIIDLMLAHVPDNKVEIAYNRSDYMGRRRELAQVWADLITVDLAAPETLLGQPMRWGNRTPLGPRSG